MGKDTRNDKGGMEPSQSKSDSQNGAKPSEKMTSAETGCLRDKVRRRPRPFCFGHPGPRASVDPAPIAPLAFQLSNERSRVLSHWSTYLPSPQLASRGSCMPGRASRLLDRPGEMARQAAHAWRKFLIVAGLDSVRQQQARRSAARTIRANRPTRLVLASVTPAR